MATDYPYENTSKETAEQIFQEIEAIKNPHYTKDKLYGATVHEHLQPEYDAFEACRKAVLKLKERYGIK